MSDSDLALQRLKTSELIGRLLTPCELEQAGGGTGKPDHCQYIQTDQPYKQNCLDDKKN